MRNSDNLTKPLADRMRPRVLSEYVGQAHILKQGKPLFMKLSVQGGCTP